MSPVDATLRRTAPALVVALLATIAGGVVSAASAHAASQSASWAAAYLVLVCGVATCGLALGRGLLARAEASARRLGAELAVWVIGNAFVIATTLAEVTWALAVSSALLVTVLALVVQATWPGRDGGSSTAAPEVPAWVRWAFTAIVVVLLVSIPIGNVLAVVRG